MPRTKKKFAVIAVVLVIIIVAASFLAFSSHSYFQTDTFERKVHLPARNVLELREFPVKPRLDLSKLSLLTANAENEEEDEVDFDSVLLDLKREREKWNGNAVKTEPKYILYWNEAYGSTDYGFCCGRDPYEKYNCPVKNCYATDNRTLFGDEMNKFSAIVFHQRNCYKDDLPGKRTPEQRYVMFMLESADYPFSFVGEEWNNFFNWTLTYRLDSDFPLLYNRIDQIAPLPTADLDSYIKEFGRRNAEKYSRGKTKTAAWFVSNCETRSLREKYVEALRKDHNVRVDIYGSCGDLKCGREKEESCWETVRREYRFYLSFENSLCVDYVTEKFFAAMSRDVVPIALSGANYSALGAPPHSHIPVFHEYDDPAELAAKLRHLEADDAAYAEYFWWKDFYEVGDGEMIRAEAFCDICKQLNNPRSPDKVYEDMEDWWFRKAKCRHIRMNHIEGGERR